MNFLCTNPMFVEQGANIIEKAALISKPTSSTPEPIVVQVDLSPDGLRSTKHTTISFNEKRASNDGNLGKSSLKNPGGSKNRNFGKILGGKDGSFRATRKINKISHGKGNFLKNKNYLKIPLSDSMSKLAHSVSLTHNGDSDAGVLILFPDRMKRKVLWSDLLDVLPQDPLPSLILGDFNAILSDKDKKDLGFIGPSYTWQKGNTQEHLDRALANDA
ncbi:hypothetical protein J1N35_040943 [Gossypium stocksii]|uniref:Endonuclease/exonuclease/phosphatase domain-containing protein n=1 Tax=Gossypium stocksii TaxID=47602 RepID=A0A9D3UEY1_9ROSI|nr:hypothetical protein J1N35_040943 [Gossypium stocksii]